MKKLSTLFKKDPNDLGRVINEVTPENEWVFTDGIPKGWVSIEDDLPVCCGLDFPYGTKYKVRNEVGEESYSYVLDHDLWYYDAVDLGITHWYHD